MSKLTKKETLGSLTINDLVLGNRSLDNIVELDELCAVLNDYVTKAEMQQNNNELDPIFKEMSSTFAEKSQLDDYLLRSDYVQGLTAESDPIFKETSSTFAKKTDLPTNYVSVDAGAENFINSYNEFGWGVCFECPPAESFPNASPPQIQLNVDPNCHFVLEGRPYTVPNDIGFGPGKGISDGATVKTWQVEDATISSELIATRRWTDSNFAKKGDTSLLSSKYDKTGGEISGNVSILSGTLAGGENAVATGKNSFAYGDAVSAIDKSTYTTGASSFAGCYGWYYDHIDFTNNAFYLTETQPTATHTSSLTGAGTIDTTFDSGLEVGDVISYVNKSKFDMELSVVNVNGNKITVEPFKNTEKFQLDEATPNPDDWSIFCASKPTVGKVPFGECAHAEGLSCNAVNAYSHAEGRQNLAYGQYSHVEGYGNSGAYAAHAEGKENAASGKYSHAEGWSNIANKSCAHAEGQATSALNACSHSEGYSTIASGEHSHAGGNSTSAFGTNAVAFGNNTYSNGYCSFAVGDQTSATSAEAFATGYKTLATGKYSFAGGQSSKAYGNQSIAYGNGAETGSTALTGGGSAVSFGYRTVAEKDNTFCMGLDAKAEHTGSFVWSGIYNSSGTKYKSHGDATFNLKPNGGINGFYIDDKNFVSCVLSAIDIVKSNASLKSQLKNALCSILA